MLLRMSYFNVAIYYNRAYAYRVQQIRKRIHSWPVPQAQVEFFFTQDVFLLVFVVTVIEISRKSRNEIKS